MAVDLSSDALEKVDEVDPRLLSTGRGRRIDGASLDEITNEQESLVRAGCGDASDEVCRPPAHDLGGALKAANP